MSEFPRQLPGLWGRNLDYGDGIAKALQEMIEKGRDVIQSGYYDLTPNEKFFLYCQKQKVIAGYPSIEIVRLNKDVEWYATRVMKEKYNYALDCSIKSPHKDLSERLLVDFSSAVQNWLNYPPNMSYQVIGQHSSIETFDSLSPNVDISHYVGQGIRTARLSYWTFVLNKVSIIPTGSAGIA